MQFAGYICNMYQQVGSEGTHASIEDIFNDKPVEQSRVSRDQKFFNAVKTGDLEIVKLFQQQIPECTEWLDRDGKRAIHHAVTHGQLEVCKYLLENEVSLDVNAQDQFGRTPLWYAKDDEFKYILIAKGATVRDANYTIKSNVQNIFLHDPHLTSYNSNKFFNAIRTGDQETVEVFLHHIPRCINWLDTEGKGALHLAVSHRQLEVCKTLLESEVSLVINVPDKSGKTSLRYAAENQDEVLLKLLISHGAVADNTNSAGDTIMAFAASKGYTPICRILIEDGNADVSSSNKSGFTPLHHASMNGHESSCQLLLSKSADLNNSKTFNGFTPLHYAALRGHYNVCVILLTGGSDPNTKCHDGATPLLLAVQTNDKQICKLLMDNKANQNLTDDVST
ncbi:nuclear factor NF-kappa-B p105 subunit-like [Amphiura filiformis]|uniref:nuclear factor NF-kappa-B p105 subunit-like n=1 Tax=Amphiura filiformis TaxID=82378 RepID=UPI003B20C051